MIGNGLKRCLNVRTPFTLMKTWALVVRERPVGGFYISEKPSICITSYGLIYIALTIQAYFMLILTRSRPFGSEAEIVFVLRAWSAIV